MTGATSPQATTSTPENSEAPRENRAGLGLLDRFDSLVERITPENRHPEMHVGKVSSPELASLAAKYLDFTINDPAFAQVQADVRALAASVLAQAEGTPRK